MNISWTSSVIRQYLIAIIVNLGSLSTGISLAWPSPMIVKLQNGTDTPLSRPITDEEGSWIVSGGYLVAIGTNFLGGMLIDKIGRKYCIILVIVPRICTSVWTIFATEVWILILCRATMVFTDYYIFVVVPVYVAEIACKEHRGALGIFLHVSSCLGMVLTMAVGPFVSYRVLNVALASIIIVTSLPLPFLPDSPVYLHSKGTNIKEGYTEEAIKVLSKIRESEEIVTQEIKDYSMSTQIKINKIALLKNKVFLKSLSLGILLCGGGNALGYNAVSFYCQTILESTHTNVQPEIASVLIGGIQLLSAISTIFFMKMFGRRTILIFSIVGIFFGMIGLGFFFKISASKGYIVTGVLNYLPLVSLILCTYCFNAGVGSMIIVVTTELFDGPSRAIGVSLSFMSNLLVVFVTSKVFAKMTLVIGPSAMYWFFSAMCILIASLIAIFLPETKGKTFREIQMKLSKPATTTETKKNEKQEC